MVFRAKYPSLMLGLILYLVTLSLQQDPVDLSYIVLKQGFKIEIFAENVTNARQIVRSPKGTIFVSTRTEGKVFALLDKDGDNKAEQLLTLATNLTMPSGIAFKNGTLYVAEISRVIKFDDIENKLDNPQYTVVRDDFPNDSWHGWKFIDFGPDGKLYLPIGGPCNVCQRPQPYASIHRMNADGTNLELVAKGVRNSVGFDWDSQGNLWFTDNGRDELGDDIPPDELNFVAKDKIGGDYGFPYCHGHDILDPEFGMDKNCNDYTHPVYEFEAHVAAVGVNFYTENGFPDRYKGGMFIAHHGSWNRKDKIGYRVVFVKKEGDTINYQVFAYGWLNDTDQTVRGRPVDTQQLPDGSLLVTDDKFNRVYRIYYEKTSNGTIALIVVAVSVVALLGLGAALHFIAKSKKAKLGKRSELQQESYHQQIDAK